MRAKSELRIRLESIEAGDRLLIRNAAPGSRDYRIANNLTQRIRIASRGKKTFSLASIGSRLTIKRET